MERLSNTTVETYEPMNLRTPEDGDDTFFKTSV
jgi:hypothetical protein